MLELCRKRTLAQSIAAMAAQFPAQYQFCPQTYVLPEDLQSLLKDFKSNKKGAPKTLILKPDSGSQVWLLVVSLRVVVCLMLCTYASCEAHIQCLMHTELLQLPFQVTITP